MEKEAVQDPKVKKTMPKQTIAFVSFLIVATIVLLGLAVYTQKPLPTPVTKPSGVVFPSYAHTTLMFSEPVNANFGNYTTSVNIDSGQNKVTAVQLEISYDPKVLTNVDIKPGPFIQNPIVLLKKVDQANGRISLALGIPLGQKGIAGTGTVAVISFNQTATAKGSTVINFLPKTAVTAQGIAQSVLKTSTGKLFYLNQNVTPSPAVNLPTSPSPVQ